MGIQAYLFHFHVSLKKNGIKVNFITKQQQQQQKTMIMITPIENLTNSEKEHTIQY